MTKVLLLIGTAVGDEPSYYVAETTKVDDLIGKNWNTAYNVISKDADEKVFLLFQSVVEAIRYCDNNDFKIEEEVNFVIY